MSAQKPIVIIGASGHAKVVADIIERQGQWTILGFIDSAKVARAEHFGYSVLGGDEELARLWERGEIEGAVIAVGDNFKRMMAVNRIFALAPALPFVSAVHPSAAVARGVTIGAGTVVMAGAVINSDASAGAHCIVNTRASLDHDSVLGDFASLAPGVTTGGGVTIGLCSAVSIGANIAHGITIGDHAVVGAGAIVVRDIPDRCVAYGVPARVVRTRGEGDAYL